jgi:HPt (histidine-containing phosphotransfer) domain-containing protein
MYTDIQEKESIQYAIKSTKDVYKHLSKNFDDKVIKKLLKVAVVSIEKYLESIHTNITIEDSKELLNDLHGFQGMLINLGLKKEAETAKQIQTVLQQDGFCSIDALVNDFMRKIFLFLNELQKTMNQC